MKRSLNSKPTPATSRSKPEAGPMMRELYRRAEAQIQQRHQESSLADGLKAVTDPRRLLHELQVHQVELEMQNSELQEARNRSEVLLEKYTDLYDFSPVGYFTFAADGIIRLANLTGAHLVGIDRSRLVGQSFFALVTATSRPSLQTFLKRVFATPAKQSLDLEVLCQGQPARVVNLEAQRTPDGEECRVALMDVSTRKQVEEKVRVSEIRYRRLFETAHDGVLLLDPVTRKITDANPFMTRLLGYPYDRLVGKELFEIGLLKDEAASQQMFRDLKRTHEIRYEDLPLETRKGRHQEVEVVANLYEEDGQPVIQCNIRDITERKESEHALRASEERFRALFESGPVAIYTCDATGMIQEFNPRAVELWGRKPVLGAARERFCGSFKLYHPNGRFLPRARCPMAEVLQGKIPGVRDTEVVVERYDGSRINAIVNIRLLKNAEGRITGAINCFYDITDRKQVETTRHRLEVLDASNRKLELEIVRRQEIEKFLKQSEQQVSLALMQSRMMQEQLRQLSRQVLSAQEEERKRISRELHDVIAQTLTGINLRLATLKKEAGHTPKKFERSLARTQQLVEKSVDIVHRFARELRPAVLDDLGLIPALHSFMKNYTAETGVHTHLTAFAEVEQLDTAQRTVLFRVAQEALTNVARHARASRVAVTITKFPGGVSMKIKDDGKSFRAESGLNAKGKNRLGLLGMRERLEMVGGHFEIESAPGKGTTVSAQIPLGKNRGGGATSVKLKH